MPAFAIANTSSPYVQATPFVLGTGYGAKYSNPSTLPTGAGGGVAFDEDHSTIFVAHDTTPNISSYPFDVDTGFGAKYSNPATLPATGNTWEYWDVACNENNFGNSFNVAVSGDYSPWIQVYTFTSGTGFGVKYTDPEGLPSPLSPYGEAQSSEAYTVGFCGNNDIATGGYWVIGQGVDQHVDDLLAWPFTSGSGFGSKYTTPYQYTGGNPYSPTWGRSVYDLSFSPQHTDIILADNTSSAQSGYPFTSGSGFGSKYSAVGVNTSYNGWAVAFSVSGESTVLGCMAYVSHYTYLATFTFTSGVGFGTTTDTLGEVGSTPDCHGVAFYGDEAVGYHGDAGANHAIWKYNADLSPSALYERFDYANDPLSETGKRCAFTPIPASEEETSSCPMPAFRSIWPYIPVELWYRFSGRAE